MPFFLQVFNTLIPNLYCMILSLKIAHVNFRSIDPLTGVLRNVDLDDKSCILIRRYSYTHVPEIENRSSNSLFAFGGFNLSRTKMLSDYCQLFVLFSFLNTFFLLIIYLICCTYVKPTKLEISTS